MNQYNDTVIQAFQVLVRDSLARITTNIEHADFIR